MRVCLKGAVTVFVCLLLAASPGKADDLADLISGLFDRDIFLADPPPDSPFPTHRTHFTDESDRLREIGGRLNESIATQLSTFPLGSPGGGFTYRYNTELGVFERSSESFGSLFAERALTIGKGKWNFGLSYLEADYDSIDDLALDDGSLEFQLLHEDCCPPDDSSLDAFFEGDLLNARTTIDVSTETTVIFATYGVTDRFDLGLAIPLVRTDLAATASLTIDRLGSGAGSAIHTFDPTDDPTATYVDLDGDGTFDRQINSASGDASGVGDVVIRGKYHFADAPGGGFAFGFDLRLPTGDEDDLLGLGATQVKGFFAGNRDWGRFSPHFNAGYTFSDSGSDVIDDLPDELNLTLGFAITASPRVTLAGDFIGRRLLDSRRIALEDASFSFRAGPGGDISSATRPVLTDEVDDVDLMWGAFGIRFNPAANLLVSLTGLVSVGDEGLQDDDLIPVLSIDFSR